MTTINKKELRSFKIVGIFGYTNKDKLGDLITEIKTDLTEEELLIYCKNNFKKYKTFSFSWIDNNKPNFIGALNL